MEEMFDASLFVNVTPAIDRSPRSAWESGEGQDTMTDAVICLHGVGTAHAIVPSSRICTRHRDVRIERAPDEPVKHLTPCSLIDD